MSALQLKDDTLVKAVLADWRTAPIDGRMRGVLAFLEKLTISPEKIGPGDAEEARHADLSNEALRQAIYVCFLFSMMGRLTDTFGCELPDARTLQRAIRVQKLTGYGLMSVPG